MKIACLGLEVVVTSQKNSGVTTTTRLTTIQLPAELPALEEVKIPMARVVDIFRCLSDFAACKSPSQSAPHGTELKSNFGLAF